MLIISVPTFCKLELLLDPPLWNSTLGFLAEHLHFNGSRQ